MHRYISIFSSIYDRWSWCCFNWRNRHHIKQQAKTQSYIN